MKRWFMAVLICVLILGNAALAQESEAEIVVTLADAAGAEVGSVYLSTLTAEMVSDMTIPAQGLEGALAIWGAFHGLTPGFHGFHIHSVGTCDPAGDRAFASAGGHVQEAGQSHGQHLGDLPSLLVLENGTAMLITVTDRVTLADLLDADGSALMIHAGADNFGNIPADRYDPDADETTQNTGDAGGRVACGVINAQS